MKEVKLIKEKSNLKPPNPSFPKPGLIALHSKDAISDLEIPGYKAAVVSKTLQF